MKAEQSIGEWPSHPEDMLQSAVLKTLGRVSMPLCCSLTEPSHFTRAKEIKGYQSLSPCRNPWEGPVPGRCPFLASLPGLPACLPTTTPPALSFTPMSLALVWVSLLQGPGLPTLDSQGWSWLLHQAAVTVSLTSWVLGLGAGLSGCLACLRPGVGSPHKKGRKKKEVGMGRKRRR